MLKTIITLLVVAFAACVFAAPLQSDATKDCIDCRSVRSITDNHDVSSWNLKLGSISLGSSSATATLRRGSPSILSRILGNAAQDDKAIASNTNIQLGPFGLQRTQLSNTYYHDHDQN